MMEPTLRKIAIVIGLGLLGVSMFWSQDGFNFDLAGVSQYGQLATFIGWFLALSVTVIQFVFSTSYKDLNPSLKLFGLLAYGYSIYTNYWGILSFQGWTPEQPTFQMGGALLSLVMDGVPEPLIAWGLYESLHGDFIGNLIKIVTQAPARVGQPQNHQQPRQDMPMGGGQSQSREARHEAMRVAQSPRQDLPPFLANQHQKNGGRNNGTVRR